MNRRELLAAVGTTGVVATAGCSSFQSTTITDPEKGRSDDSEFSLNFRTESGTSVATLTVILGRRRYPGPGGGEVPVKIAITHGDETKVENVRFDLRGPPNHSDAGSPAEIAFTTPFAKPHPSIELYTDPDDSSTILEISDLGEQGDGTLVFDFRLTGLRDATAELAVDAAVGMTELATFGREYTLEGLTTVPLPN